MNIFISLFSSRPLVCSSSSSSRSLHPRRCRHHYQGSFCPTLILYTIFTIISIHCMSGLDCRESPSSTRISTIPQKTTTTTAASISWENFFPFVSRNASHFPVETTTRTSSSSSVSAATHGAAAESRKDVSPANASSPLAEASTSSKAEAKGPLMTSLASVFALGFWKNKQRCCMMRLCPCRGMIPPYGPAMIPPVGNGVIPPLGNGFMPPLGGMGGMMYPPGMGFPGMGYPGMGMPGHHGGHGGEEELSEGFQDSYSVRPANRPLFNRRKRPMSRPIYTYMRPVGGMSSSGTSTSGATSVIHPSSSSSPEGGNTKWTANFNHPSAASITAIDQVSGGVYGANGGEQQQEEAGTSSATVHHSSPLSSSSASMSISSSPLSPVVVSSLREFPDRQKQHVPSFLSFLHPRNREKRNSNESDDNEERMEDREGGDRDVMTDERSLDGWSQMEEKKVTKREKRSPPSSSTSESAVFPSAAVDEFRSDIASERGSLTKNSYRTGHHYPDVNLQHSLLFQGKGEQRGASNNKKRGGNPAAGAGGKASGKDANRPDTSNPHSRISTRKPGMRDNSRPPHSAVDNNNKARRSHQKDRRTGRGD